MLRVLMIAIPLAVTIYALIDAITAPKWDVRTLPKAVWIAVIIVLLIVGAALWFVLGRPTGSRRPGHPSRAIGPDDDPGFLSSIDRPKPRK